MRDQSLADNDQSFLLTFFFDLDAQRFQKLEILVVDFEFGICGQSRHQRSFVRGLLTLFADADRGLKDQKNIVATLFDAGDDFGNLFRIGERFVDGFAEFFHQVFELLIHIPPDRRLPSLSILTRWSTGLDAKSRPTVFLTAQVCVIVAPDTVKIES